MTIAATSPERAPPTSVAVAATDFATLYRENLPFVVGVLRYAGVPEESLRDLCHEVFVRVHQTLDRYDPSRPLRGWLHGITLNIAREFRRARRRDALHDELSETLPWGGLDPERRAQLGEDLVTLQSVLETMDPTRREVFEMRHVLGMTIPEIASASGGTSTDTLYARLYAAEEIVEKAISRSRRVR